MGRENKLQLKEVTIQQSKEKNKHSKIQALLAEAIVLYIKKIR